MDAHNTGVFQFLGKFIPIFKEESFESGKLLDYDIMVNVLIPYGFTQTNAFPYAFSVFSSA